MIYIFDNSWQMISESTPVLGAGVLWIRLAAHGIKRFLHIGIKEVRSSKFYSTVVLPSANSSESIVLYLSVDVLQHYTDFITGEGQSSFVEINEAQLAYPMGKESIIYHYRLPISDRFSAVHSGQDIRYHGESDREWTGRGNHSSIVLIRTDQRRRVPVRNFMPTYI